MAHCWWIDVVGVLPLARQHLARVLLDHGGRRDASGVVRRRDVSARAGIARGNSVPCSRRHFGVYDDNDACVESV